MKSIWRVLGVGKAVNKGQSVGVELALVSFGGEPMRFLSVFLHAPTHHVSLCPTLV